jgi:SAM-dependent methyltransferase
MTAAPTQPVRQRDRMYTAADSRPWFSGTEDFTGYMREALDALCSDGVRRSILDLPAGRGQFTDALRRAGHEVTPADINRHRPDYIVADMTARLPFADAAFDAAVCLEGIEHIPDPLLLLGELMRVLRPGGMLVLSTPNIQSYYSRLRFLFTGTFYQFNPAEIRDLPPGAAEDRFHISPISYHWLRYFAVYFGGRVTQVRGDRIKKKWLLPLFGLIHLLGRPWSRALFFSRRARPWEKRNRQMHRHLNSRAMLLSRTLLVVIEKDS